MVSVNWKLARMFVYKYNTNTNNFIQHKAQQCLKPTKHIYSSEDNQE